MAVRSGELHLMKSVTVAALLSLVTLICLPGQTVPSGEEILGKVSANYRSPRRLLLSITARGSYADQKGPLSLTLAAEMPDKLRLQGNASGFGMKDLGDGPVLVVFDGEFGWVHDSNSKQYVKIPRASPRGSTFDPINGNVPEFNFDRPEFVVFYVTGVFLSRYIDYFATARIRTTEKIPVNGKDVECYVVELAQRGWTLANQLMRYTWWVDAKKFIVWREVLEGRTSSTAAWEWMSSSNFEEVILNTPLPKDTFVFTPPEGSRLVERPAQ